VAKTLESSGKNENELIGSVEEKMCESSSKQHTGLTASGSAAEFQKLSPFLECYSIAQLNLTSHIIGTGALVPRSPRLRRATVSTYLCVTPTRIKCNFLAILFKIIYSRSKIVL